jgi:sulfatase maturation enzyme AslB (radical SAM superfamily)
MGLINSKINFHQLENFSNEIRFNENNDHSKIRIELLTNAKDITDLIAYYFQRYGVKIEGTIQISLVPIKKRNQLLKQYCH